MSETMHEEQESRRLHWENTRAIDFALTLSSVVLAGQVMSENVSGEIKLTTGTIAFGLVNDLQRKLRNKQY